MEAFDTNIRIVADAIEETAVAGLTWHPTSEHSAQEEIEQAYDVGHFLMVGVNSCIQDAIELGIPWLVQATPPSSI